MPRPSRSALAALLLGVGMLPSLALAQPAEPAPTAACTRGSSGIGDGYFPVMGNAGYDVRHYALDIDLDVAAGSIREGSATILATALLDLCAFNLDFNGLKIDAVTVDGVPATWRRNGQELTIAPARPVARGGGFVVAVRYHGEPLGTDTASVAEVAASFAPEAATSEAAIPGTATPLAGDEPGADDAAAGVEPGAGEAAADETAEGFGLPLSPDADRYGWSIGGWWRAGDSVFVVGEPRGAEFWYPVNGHPADKATYAIALTVDDPYAAVANGPLVETIDGAGETTFVYAPRDPMSSYLVTLQAGELEIVEDATADGLPLRYAFAEGVPAAQRDLFVAVQPEILAFFAERFGPYPFDLAGASVVAAPLPFALETQTMPTYGALLDLPEAGAVIDEAALAGLAETIAHETAHQWFGNAVSPLRWEDVFLNEGFAQYATYLWVEERDGAAVMERRLQASYDRIAASIRLGDPAALAAATGADILAPLGPLPDEVVGALLDLAGVASLAALEALPAPAVMAALEAFGVPPGAVLGSAPVLTGDPGPDDLFSIPYVYERGALTMHALRREVGDETFFAILREWAAAYSGGNATVQDFVAHAEAVSGEDLAPLFDAWLFRLELPAFPG